MFHCHSFRPYTHTIDAQKHTSILPVGPCFHKRAVILNVEVSTVYVHSPWDINKERRVQGTSDIILIEWRDECIADYFILTRTEANLS